MSVPLVRASRDAIRYGFAVGKVRVLEARLFGIDLYERLITARDLAEQRRILSDTALGRFLEGADTAEAVERGLDDALDDTYGFLDEAGLPEAVVDFFRVRYDFANLKALLKAEELGIMLEPLLSPLGTVDPGDFIGELDDLPPILRDLHDRLTPSENEAPEPGSAERGADERVEEAVDRAMFARLAEDARQARSPFLAGLAALMADVANARALVRGRLEGRPFGEVAGMLADAGSIRGREIEAAYKASPLELAALLATHPALAALGEAGLSEDPLARFDVAADEILLRYVASARAVAFGPEPVVGYVMHREAQIVMVRVLLLGKLAGLDADSLRARLRGA